MNYYNIVRTSLRFVALKETPVDGKTPLVLGTGRVGSEDGCRSCVRVVGSESASRETCGAIIDDRTAE